MFRIMDAVAQLIVIAQVIAVAMLTAVLIAVQHGEDRRVRRDGPRRADVPDATTAAVSLFVSLIPHDALKSHPAGILLDAWTKLVGIIRRCSGRMDGDLERGRGPNPLPLSVRLLSYVRGADDRGRRRPRPRKHEGASNRPMTPSELDRMLEIDRTVKALQPGQLRAGLPDKVLEGIAVHLVSRHPEATAEELFHLAVEYMRSRMRAILEVWDACEYGINSLIGEPSVEPLMGETDGDPATVMAQLVSAYEEGHCRPCRFVNEK